MVSGKKAYESFDSRRQMGVDRSEWIVVRDIHEGIVVQEKFDRVNGNVRSVVRGKKREPVNKGNYSVIICSRCGLTFRQGMQKVSSLPMRLRGTWRVGWIGCGGRWMWY